MSAHALSSAGGLLEGLAHSTARLLSSSPLTSLLVLASVLALIYRIYLYLLPKPIPNIPYDPHAAASLLGDLPTLAAQIRTGDIRPYLGTLATQHASPIVQIFGRSVRPTLVISDFRTAQDILLRRTREFERPGYLRTSLRAMIPHHHITMRTADPQFRRNRELVKDLMAAPFLHAVNAPRVWACAGRLVELWGVKAAAAGGRPFEAGEDVAGLTFDVIKEAALGRGDSTLIGRYLEELRAAGMDGNADQTLAAGEDRDAPFPFAKPPQDDVLEAQHRMNAAISNLGVMPAKWFHAVNNLRPHMREAFAWKENMLRRQVGLAVQRMEAEEPLESALDYMIQREIGAAKKERREPVFESPTMYDELYGYIGAGHDTTASTFTWGLKHLTHEPDAQTKARQNLHETYAQAHAENRPPTAAEIITTHAPYLDAVIEEVLRLSGPVPGIARETTTATTIMGRAVPARTQVFVAFWGAGYTSPSAHDTLAPESAGTKVLPSYAKRDDWDGSEPEKFVPERWLAEDAEGRMVYDAQAGPMLSFSLGIRGCFGKRLAYVTLRMLFTLLLWNFELQPVPEALDSWKAVTILTRKPRQCYVRLAKVR